MICIIILIFSAAAPADGGDELADVSAHRLEGGLRSYVLCSIYIM